MQQSSQIVDFFAGKTVFLTGCTGFLGKLILEKLLRVCRPKKIYLLVRSKKQKSEESRFREIFELPVFERIRNEFPEYLEYLETISGDCALENLGISEENWSRLLEETQVILHCAATVRFDQILRTAYNINIRATKDLLEFAKKMPKLQSFVHVSTAYSNCPRKDIDEVCYKAPLSHTQLGALLTAIEDNDLILRMTPNLLGEWPNTYSFTKCISEEMVHNFGVEHSMPIAIIRPSIIVSTYKEPMPGWIDNFYGPIGVTYGAGLGLLRTLHCIPECHADMVPADYVINAILASAWAVGSSETTNIVPIYNFTAAKHAITWRQFGDEGQKLGLNLVCSKTVWRVLFRYNRWEWKHRIEMFLLHTVPAHTVDLIVKMIGKKPIMVEHYKRIHKFIDVISYFTTREWNFSTKNVENLNLKFNDDDRKLFEIRMDTFDWKDFMPEYLKGGRVYLVKDPLSTIPAAKKRYKRLEFAHWTLVFLLGLIVSWFLYFVYKLLA